MNTVELTTQEIAVKLGIEKGDAYGLVGFLEKQGLLRPVGTRKDPGAKGKGATLYACDPYLAEKAKQLLERLFVSA